MTGFLRLFLPVFSAVALLAVDRAEAQAPPLGDAGQGQTIFAQNCALCHAAALGPGNIEIDGQGPSLAGVVGRPGGRCDQLPVQRGVESFRPDVGCAHARQISQRSRRPRARNQNDDGDLRSPDAANLIAYLQTLGLPLGVKIAAPPTEGPAIPPAQDPGAWQNAKPGVAHHINVNDLPAPYATKSVDNSVRYVKLPGNEQFETTPASLAVPPGFTVALFAQNLWNPRCLRVAPNGDVFLAETGGNRIHVFRTVDGADRPSLDQVYATGVDLPFGHRLLSARQESEVALRGQQQRHRPLPLPQRRRRGPWTAAGRGAKLCDSPGGHTTRDIAFSPDGKRMYISVGSSSNVAESMEATPPGGIKAWKRRTASARRGAWKPAARKSWSPIPRARRRCALTRPAFAMASGWRSIRGTATCGRRSTSGMGWATISCLTLSRE